MKSFAEIKRLLQDEAKPYLMARYPLTEIGVFGSYVRGEADADSDLDVLYAMDFNKQPYSLFDLTDIRDYLAELTGVPKIDLVNKKTLKPFIAPYILRDLVEL